MKMSLDNHNDGITPFAAAFETSEIETNGANIHVRVGGRGPIVVMLHGFGTTGDMWAAMAGRDVLVTI